MKFFRRSNVKLQARKKRFKIFFRGLLAVSCAAGITVGFRYLSLHLEKLKIHSILIEGAGVSPGAGGPLNTGAVLNKSGLRVGQPIFSVDLKEVVKRLQGDPWIDQVKVSRKLPYTLLISLVRHEPRLILSVGKFYYVGSKGEIFKELSSSSDSRDFPVLTGLNREEIEQDPPKAREILQGALSLLNAYEGGESAQGLGLSEIHYDKALGYSLFPENGRFRVLVGFDQFETKLKRLDQAVEKLKKMNQSFASIDLNYEGKVILTM